jgi:hypothetical protein
MRSSEEILVISFLGVFFLMIIVIAIWFAKRHHEQNVETAETMSMMDNKSVAESYRSRRSLRASMRRSTIRTSSIEEEPD